MFSPDGQRIVTASDDSTARVWKASSDRLLATLSDTSEVRSAVFSPKRPAYRHGDKTARVFRVVTLSEIAELLSN